MESLVWFRSDLRLEDNPALFHACRDSAGGVIAVFLLSLDPGEPFRPAGRIHQDLGPEVREVDSSNLHDPRKLRVSIPAGLEYPEPLVDHRSARIRSVTAFEKAKQLSTH